MDYKVLQRRERHDGTDVVLCELGANRATPYVTWVVRREWSGADNVAAGLGRGHGHYFSELSLASADYCNR